MKEKNIEERIIQIIKKQFIWLSSQEEISVNASLRNDLAFDSIAIVNLQVLLEDEFDFRFNPVVDDFSKIFYSIETLTYYISLLIE
ncbi:acyl carrier protein [Bacteroides sp. 519]|uniref:acyl carrier protein n=1 Tax=Bacteroides sp. 519 TaxID=2302937 RepID=UPI0013D36986|nr:acyl carrier protein [Bacteroides sp. 519]NDV57969.1 acyl carrier protein [Bacteroides sp. 519]